MIQRKQRTKNHNKRKAPSAQQLRQETWGSIERIIGLLLKLIFEILSDQAATEQADALVPISEPGSERSVGTGHTSEA